MIQAITTPEQADLMARVAAMDRRCDELLKRAANVRGLVLAFREENEQTRADGMIFALTELKERFLTLQKSITPASGDGERNPLELGREISEAIATAATLAQMEEYARILDSEIDALLDSKGGIGKLKADELWVPGAPGGPDLSWVWIREVLARIGLSLVVAEFPVENLTDRNPVAFGNGLSGKLADAGLGTYEGALFGSQTRIFFAVATERLARAVALLKGELEAAGILQFSRIGCADGAAEVWRVVYESSAREGAGVMQL